MELKQRVKKLESEVNKLQQIIMETPGNIYWKNRDQSYSGCNQQMLEMHNLTSHEQFIGKTMYDLLDKALADKYTKQDEQIMHDGKERVIYERGIDKYGNPADYITRKKPLFDENNQVVGLVGVSLNITDKRKAELLHKQNEIATAVIQKLKTIAGSLAHEIKTPLAGIKMGLTVLKSFFTKAKQTPDQLTSSEFEQQERWTNRLIKRVDSGNAFISMQLKNMTTEGVDPATLCQSSLAQCVQQAIDTYYFDNEDLRQKIYLQITDYSITNNPLLTQHIIHNLLKNALYFIEDIGRGEIFISSEENNQYYVLRFKDTAKGMSTDEANCVFDQFFTKRKGGSGLGLHFCQLVMHDYQGYIECHSQEGQYTEFMLFFPKNFTFKQAERLTNLSSDYKEEKFFIVV